jgi:hypothetical protein
MKNRPLVALSSAAIVAVYTAGYVRTRAAAERFDVPTPARKPLTPRVPDDRTPPRAEGRLEIPPPAAVPAITRRARPASQEPASPSVSPSVVPHADVTPPKSDVNAPIALNEQAVQGLAQPGIDAPPPEPPPPVARGEYKDGSYTGWGYCRHGDIQASVVVAAGRIVSAKVVQCLTRYSCNWIEPLYPQVVERQNAEVDYISGASESSDAFHDAVAEALAKAK